MRRAIRARAVFVVVALISGPSASAAGPEQIAGIDRALWPEQIDTSARFDAASFAENMFFARAMFEALQAFDAELLDLGARATHRDSVAVWRNRTIARVLQNIRLALAYCGPTESICASEDPPTAENLGSRARAAADRISATHPAWADAASIFYRTYVREQLRLAALFPAPTSEILPLGDDELLGDRLPDRTFLLTFDDGPTSKRGETDRLTTWLRKEGLSATFFVLGQSLAARRATSSPQELRALYAGQCVGSHGRVHKPHPGLVTWRESIDRTRANLLATIPASGPTVPFRPPYGQRNPEMLRHLADLGDPVVLWNIDSQDWNAKLSAARVEDRVFTLMLLWRSGIVLFHDIHPRALGSLPSLAKKAKAAGVSFQACYKP